MLCAGAGQGIGRCFAHTLGEAGAQVAVVDINKAAADDVVEELKKKGIRAIAIQVCFSRSPRHHHTSSDPTCGRFTTRIVPVCKCLARTRVD